MILENLVKGFFKDKKDKSDPSISATDTNIDKSLTDTTDLEQYTLGYFDDNSNIFDRREKASKINSQNDVIRRYRKASMVPEVSGAIEEIINEMAFVVGNKDIVSLDIDEKADMNSALKNAFTTNFDEILTLINFKNDADSILKQYYVDGQLRFGCSYDQKNMKRGISAIYVMSPISLYFDSVSKKWKYYTDNNNNYAVEDEEEKALILSDEELVTIDSGLYSDGIILSNLHTTLKVINQLGSLEDMLIPLRFSRSVSRRVFNIDVGDLPYGKAMQAVKEIQDKFKYKKYYDVENGTISNSSNIASIVEDYFFPNRGGKGTSVDVLDESGNLGETGDIEYFQKKLYASLKVPLGRIPGSDKGNTFDYSGTQIENDEIRFFAFINRIRQRFNNGLLELLRRHMVSKKLLSSSDFNKYKSLLSVQWEKESNFLERQNLELLKSRLETYSTVKEFIGDIYSKSWVLKNILNMSEEEIIEMKREMEEELLGDTAVGDPNMGSAEDGTDTDDTANTDDTSNTSGEDDTDTDNTANTKPDDTNNTQDTSTEFN